MNPLLRRRLLRTGALGAFALGVSSAFVLWENADRGDPPELFRLSSPVPRFTLPALADGSALSSADLAGQAKPVLINFFASWCGPCAQEAPVLLTLRDQGITIWGVAYKDQPDATQAFLRQHGDPYARVGRDEMGGAGEAFGLFGVPESFLVDPRGVVQWHWTGGLSEDTVRRSLAPRLKTVS